MAARELGKQREIRPGFQSLGGMAIRPASGSGEARTASSNAGSSVDRDAALLLLRADIHLDIDLGNRPDFSPAATSALSSDMRSSEWMTSKSSTASSALFDCSCPIMCSRRPGWAARSAGHFAAASATRFSPKSVTPAAISGSISCSCALLGNRDQRHVRRITPRSLCGASDLIPDLGQAGCGVTHCARYRNSHGS